MNLTTFGIVMAGVLLNAGAQLLLKAGAKSLGVLSLAGSSLPGMVLDAAMQPYIIIGLACYVLSAGLWIVALSRVDVTVAYPMLSIGYVVTAILAWQLFGEALTAGRLAGMGIILVGVVVLARS